VAGAKHTMAASARATRTLGSLGNGFPRSLPRLGPRREFAAGAVVADAKSTTVGREDRAIGGAEMSSLGNARRCYPGSNHDDLSVSSWLTPSISRSPISRRLSDFPYFDGWRRIALRRICQGIQCRRCRDLSYIAHFTESRSRLDKLAQDGPVLQLLLRRSSWKPLRTRSRGARKLLEGPGGPKFAGWPRLAKVPSKLCGVLETHTSPRAAMVNRSLSTRVRAWGLAEQYPHKRLRSVNRVASCSTRLESFAGSTDGLNLHSGEET